MTIDELFDWSRFAGLTITLTGEIGRVPPRLVAEGIGERFDLHRGVCVHTDERGSRRLDSIDEIT